MISQSEFNQIKSDLSGNDPLVKRVKLSDIQLDDNSIKHNHIEIEGSRVPVSDKFFNRLGQMVNINAGLITKMNKNSDKEIETKLAVPNAERQSAVVHRVPNAQPVRQAPPALHS
jgi:hypothetical protein